MSGIFMNFSDLSAGLRVEVVRKSNTKGAHFEARPTAVNDPGLDGVPTVDQLLHAKAAKLSHPPGIKQHGEKRIRMACI